MSPEERLNKSFELSALTKELFLHGLRKRFSALLESSIKDITRTAGEMSQRESLKLILEVLNNARIPYILTGSIISSLQGEPRSTHDIDIVAAIEQTLAIILVKSFPPPEYYLDKDAINDAINHNEMFNLINTTTGDKINLWMLTKVDKKTSFHKFWCNK